MKTELLNAIKELENKKGIFNYTKLEALKDVLLNIECVKELEIDNNNNIIKLYY